MLSYKPRPKPRQPGRSEAGRKKVIVAGSREFDDYELLFITMEELTKKLNDPIILSGNARGADQLGEKWAHFNWYLVKLFIPDWDKHGKGAGFKRNEEMAAEADYAAIFWDGQSRGTAHCIEMCKKYNVRTHIVRV